MASGNGSVFATKAAIETHCKRQWLRKTAAETHGKRECLPHYSSSRNTKRRQCLRQEGRSRTTRRKAVAYRRTSLAGEGDGAGGDGAGLNKPAAVVSTDGRAPSEDPAGVDAGH